MKEQTGFFVKQNMYVFPMSKIKYRDILEPLILDGVRK